jgi:hypothetical protein
MTRLITPVLCMLLLVLQITSSAQERTALSDQVINLPDKLFSKLNDKMEKLDKQLSHQTDKTLHRLKKQEARIKRKLYRKDPALAKTIFEDSPDRYNEFIQHLHTNSFSIDPRKVGDYLPDFDSLKSALGFLGSGQTSLSNVTTGKQAQQALTTMNGIQNKLKYVSEIRNYIKSRKQFLSSMLSKQGVSHALKKMNKDVYYYGQYIQEYKSILNDPSKMEKLAINLLNKIPAFREFVQKNSFLSSVFAPNAMFAMNNGANVDIPGLQTRTQVNQLINSSMVSAGSGGQDILGQRLADVKKELDELKGKVSAWDDNAELPAFKPNEMKSKSFLKKLEFGTNLQLGKSNSFLPSTADIGGQIAYKFHQNGSFGLGASYKLGFGSLRQISITHQGIGLRSFLDYKLKGSIYVNGGFEYNHNAAFKSMEQLRNFSAWQSSALIGVSKKYKVSKKLKGNIVALYDFLHRAHTPTTQPFVFRIGYNF